MAIRDRVQSLLTDPRFHDGSCDDDLGEAVLELSGEVGWNCIARALIAVLEDTSCVNCWGDAVTALFCCDVHARGIPCNEHYLIALLYDCLRLEPSLGSDFGDPDDWHNLVWSIVHQIKGVGYLSDYDPRNDPEVCRQKVDR